MEDDFHRSSSRDCLSDSPVSLLKSARFGRFLVHQGHLGCVDRNKGTPLE
jgi:hypothetical protein